MNDSEIVVRPKICKEFTDVGRLYELVDGRPRGVGQYSEVFRAKGRGGEVALKVTKKKMRGIEHLVRKETEALRAVTSDRIVGFKEILEDELTFYTVLEWVGGDDLGERLSRVKKLPEKHAKTVVKQTLQALTALHSTHYLHRDVKPSNIMFVTPSSHQVKLVDFGSAEHLPPTSDPITKPVGTQLYMPPEMLKRKGYRHPTDIWSLGVLTYLTLTGTEPFTGTGPSLINSIIEGEYYLPMTVSQEARSFIEGCLKVDPGKRMTAGVAGEHPWVKGHCAEKRISFDLGSGGAPQRVASSSARTANSNRKFRSAGIAVVAAIRLLTLTTPSPVPLHRGKRFAKSGAALCNACNTPILDRSKGIEALDGYLHDSCFKCGICKGMLEQVYIEYKGAPCHRICIEKVKEKLLPRCRVCPDRVKGGIIWEDGHYHEECFRCKKCGGEFTKGAAEFDGEPYHGTCLDALKRAGKLPKRKGSGGGGGRRPSAGGKSPDTKPLRVPGARTVLTRKSYPPPEGGGGGEVDNDEPSHVTGKPVNSVQQPVTDDQPEDFVVSNKKKDRAIRVAGAPEVKLPRGGGGGGDDLAGFQSAFCHECGQKHVVSTAKFCMSCGTKRH